MIYHLLPEWEPFSAYRGGAVCHTVANLMRLDPNRTVVASATDSTWNYEPKRMLIIPRIRSYSSLRARRFYPPMIKELLLRQIYAPLLSRLQPNDIVWCHNRLVCAHLGRSIWSKRAKVICHFHDGMDPHSTKLAFKNCQPDASIFVSEFLRRHWLHFLPSMQNTVTVHNGADENMFYPGARCSKSFNAAPTILFVGRLDQQKGVHVLLGAMALLAERNVNVVCKIVGSSYSGGSKETRYVRSLFESKPSNVQFEDHCTAKEIAEKFRSADVFCCPSVWQEPFGKVNIEAMACGIPVIASRVGGIPEIASKGGIVLVEPNSVVDLANALQGLIEDETLRLKIGMEGLASFRQRFTWTAIYGQYQQILERVLSEGSSKE